MERITKALEQARISSKLHSLLDKFFVTQTAETIQAMKTCAHEELLDNRAYLLAIEKLEQMLLEYIETYKVTEARRLHVRDTD